MIKYLAILAAVFALASFGAVAQTSVVINCQTGTTSTGQPIYAPASATNPCPVTGGGAGAGVVSIPALITRHGTLLLSVTTSTAVTTAGNVLPSGAIVFPAPSNVVSITNAAAATNPVYVCPLGGACSSTNGIELPVGVGRQWNIGASATSPTVACSTAAANACVLDIEE